MMICCFLSTAVTYYFINNANISSHVLIESGKATLLLDSINRNMLQAETCKRGYMLTKNGVYMDKFNASINNTNVEFAKLQQIMSHDPKMIELEKILKEEQEYFYDTLMLYKTDSELAKKDITMAEGKKNMDTISAIIDYIKAKTMRDALKVIDNSYYYAKMLILITPFVIFIETTLLIFSYHITITKGHINET